MNTGNKVVRIFIWLGVVLLQLIMTQVVTFLLSLLVPGMDNFPQTHPLLFVLILGITFTVGNFLTGWLAFILRWLKMEPKPFARLIGTLVGAYLPLVVALFVDHPLEAGNPFFFVSILASVVGFYVPGWLARN
ncbi:MAG TPA: hypothetical protein VII97_08290 [Anaerolineales bacterium]